MIEIDNITKSYRTLRGRRYIFRNLSFSIPSGRNVAIIGRNGAGKSTLMRLLGGADKPDSGVINCAKSISWPVGLSGGFQGSMSARDNIKFVCRVYGLSASALSDRVKYVSDFAELGTSFDEPVKNYSSGMRSRLAFGLSMAFDFDYYLIDEVMSVGDAQFRKKCNMIFEQKLKKSNIILVSHSMDTIANFCDLVLLVKGGSIQAYDDIREGIQAYRS